MNNIYFNPWNFWIQAKTWLRSVFWGCGASILLASPSIGAEKISLFYELLELSIPVASLESFAEDGKIDRHLAFYTRQIKPQDLERLRILLNKRILLSSTTLYRFFYSSSGKLVLQFLSDLMPANSQESGFYALRGTLILAAADSEGLTLLNILKKFPLSEIRIDLKRVLQTVEAFNRLSNKTQQAIELIEKQAILESSEQTNLVELADLSQLGNGTWHRENLRFYDRDRNRQFTVKFYRPQHQNTMPVLVISLGLGSDLKNFSQLAEHLASYGFAVAVIDHPGSNRQQLENRLNGWSGRAKNLIEPREFIDRPLDVSYFLDELQRMNQSNDSKQGKFDLKRVGVIGYSFGGYTALALAGARLNLKSLKQMCYSDRIDLNVGNLSMLLQCLASELPVNLNPYLRDRRVQAIFVLNSFSSQIFGKQGLRQLQIPTMFVAGSNDLIAPALLEQVCPFSWLTVRDRYFALIKGGTHVYAASTRESSLENLQGLANPHPNLSRRYLKTFSVAFAKTYVARQPSYRLYLNATYGRSISQSSLKLRLVQSLDATPQIARSSRAICDLN
jgi:predicted dienelactone hydrolase